MNWEQLLARYQELGAEIRALITEAPEGVIDEERQGQIDALKAERAGVLASIEELRELEEEEREFALPTETPNPADSLEVEERGERGARRVRVGPTRDHDRPWENFGEQLIAIRNAHPEIAVPVDERLFATHERAGGNVEEARAATGMSQASPSDGGFLVDPVFSDRIWDEMNQDDQALLPMTDTQSVTGESLTFKANAETSRATGSRWGGVQGYWIAEAEEVTASSPKLRNVKIEPHELAVLVYVTDKLLRNSPQSLGDYVSRAAGEEINFLAGDGIVNGNGAGKPKGILQSGSLVTVAKETSQAAATILHQNISKMWSRMHPRSRANAIWLHNVDIEPELDNIFLPVTDVAGTENVGGITQGLMQQGARTLKGRPLVPSEFCATLGSVGDLILWDPSSYLSGIRGGIRSAMSIHVRFTFQETAFRFSYDIDGQPWLGETALTPFKGTNTQTTHVALALRA